MNIQQFVCKACQRSFKRKGDRSQHYFMSSSPGCRKIGAEVQAARIRPTRFASRQLRPFQRQNSKTLPSPSDTKSDGGDPPCTFEGDFYGQDYTAADFPGFDNVPESSDDEEEGEQEEQEEAELEQTWEPERSTAAAVPLEDNMEVDEPLPPGPPPPQAPFTPLLRHLPAHREGSDGNLWAPFTLRIDWEVARWAKTRGTGSTAFSDLLSIQGIDEALGLSYKNSTELNRIIDQSLPSRRPSFIREEVVIAGKAFDLYKRDIMECVRALYGSPDHSQYLCFMPERHYTDASKTRRLYHRFEVVGFPGVFTICSRGRAGLGHNIPLSCRHEEHLNGVGPVIPVGTVKDGNKVNKSRRHF
ncbi:hypothetical protein K435DRAFT_875663 [Dendrothele bispora CBS 962.96]|uniref:Uncharacterized protein n=1 Tax=Dendrothele bispora (strain CBS 962.96) TaxID=1314807 RepID=A0A4S8KUX6_DENBC|nr:hypothetical protein K435DRAFT_875663 [Dendrothele bispora CBS 962.96]